MWIEEQSEVFNLGITTGLGKKKINVNLINSA